MLIYSLKHVQSYKYEEHLQECDMKLQNISYTKAQLLATSDSYWTWMLQLLATSDSYWTWMLQLLATYIFSAIL